MDAPDPLSAQDMLDAVLAALLPTYTVFGATEQGFFRDFVAEKVGQPNAPPETLLRAVQQHLGIRVVVLDGGDGRVLGVRPSPSPDAHAAEEAAAPGPMAPPGDAADRSFQRKVGMLNSRFEREQRSAESRRRFLEFQRTGLRSEIRTGGPGASVAFGELPRRRRGDLMTGVPWARMSIWHRRQALTAYGPAKPGDDEAYARRVREALEAPDPTRALRGLAAPAFDAPTGRVLRLVPREGGASESETAAPRPERPAGDEPPKKRGHAQKRKQRSAPKKKKKKRATNGCAHLLKQCREIRERQRASQERSVKFTGSFISTNT